jgi:hypothetical protein
MAKKFESFTPSEVCEYLRRSDSTLDVAVYDKIAEHKIDGEIFMSLTEEYLREVAPLLGDRVRIKRILNSLLVTCSSVSILVIILW